MADMAGIGEGEAAMAKSTRTTNTSGAAGHRQRLRERFLAGENVARTEAALLELLLTYAIPQQDVAPLVHALLARFGNLAGVLAAESSLLLEVKGIKESSATLLKLVDAIKHTLAGDVFEEPHDRYAADGQLSLFYSSEAAMEMPEAAGVPTATVPERETSDVPAWWQNEPQPKASAIAPRRGTEMFTTAFMRDAIEVLPRLPDTDSAEEIRVFLRRSLHYSAEQSRQRVAAYVMRRMFPSGAPDRALLAFARQFAGRQELRDAAFYRFCVAEPLTFALMEDLVLPAISAGRVERSRIRAYLTERFPSSNSVLKCIQAFADALGPAGIAKADKTSIHIAYRDILLPSFAFVLHSEFPAPGMYDISKLEQNRAVRALLWNPDRMLTALYELRNRGLLSKVSEIDSVRQFTTRMTLEQAVEALAAGGSRA